MTPQEIRERRLAYPLTQAEMATQLGVHKNAVRHWEAGRRTPLPKQARALEVLFGLREPDPSEIPAPPPLASLAGRWDCLRADPPCTCRCHAVARGRRAGKERVDRRAWRPAEVAYLKAAIARDELPEDIADYLTREYGRRRSRRAVVTLAQELGLSFRTGWYTRQEAARVLGVHPTRVGRWGEMGLLPTARHVSRTRGHETPWWRIEGADLEAFVLKHAGLLLDPTRIRDRALKSRAEVWAIVNRRRAG